MTKIRDRNREFCRISIKKNVVKKYDNVFSNFLFIQFEEELIYTSVNIKLRQFQNTLFDIASYRFVNCVT
jgi:hypothetical protein